MRTNTIIKGVMSVAFAAPLLMSTQSMASDSFSLRISGENPVSGLDIQMAQRFAENLKDEFGEAFNYELFHTGALGNEEVHLQQIRTGQIDVYPMGSDAVSLDSKWAIFDMPFLFSDRETVAKVLDGEVGEQLRASMRDSANLEVLAFGELGFRQITNSTRPIVEPQDLQGVQIRVPGSRARILSFSTFGAEPISMNFGELYLALQQGTVDGQENPLVAIRARSFYEVQDYLSLSNHVYSPVTLVMNGRKYDSLTPEQQDGVNRAAQEAAEYSRELGTQADREILDELSESMQVNEINVDSFREASVVIWEEVGAMAGDDFAKFVIETVNK